MTNIEIIEFLSQMVSKERYDILVRTLNNRTNYITVVLEDIFQTHNASAVLRSCDCFGIETVHMIENKYSYMENPDVAMGSAQWLHLNRYNTEENNTLSTIQKLRNEGYRIVATTPHTNDVNIEDLDLTKGKIALFFGTERHGLSQLAMDNADEFVKIPMYGFTESFNISVSAALCLYVLANKLRQTDINWQLSDKEKESIMIEWLKLSFRNADEIIAFQEKRLRNK